MTQFTGTAGRSHSHLPAFVAGALIAAAAEATAIVLAVALGFSVGPLASSTAHEGVGPNLGVEGSVIAPYDGAIDPTELQYILRGNHGFGWSGVVPAGGGTSIGDSGRPHAGSTTSRLVSIPR